MSFRNSLKICRLLVAVLLFNMAAPIAMADSNNPNTVLICSTAGLIEVNIDDLSEVESSGSSVLHQSSQHCAFCKLTDSDFSLNSYQGVYPAPSADLTLHYQSIVPPSPSKVIIKHALMRAPPAIYL